MRSPPVQPAPRRYGEGSGIPFIPPPAPSFCDTASSVAERERFSSKKQIMKTQNFKYEDVFNGNVEKEIGMYSRKAMIVGMNLKASDKNIRNFDMNI